MGAYDKNYLNDADNLSRLLFEEMAKKKDIDFSNFVKGYMSCHYRKIWDNGSTRVINMTYDELMEYLETDCPYLFKKGKTDVDILEAGWIGKMYSHLQYEMKISSKELFEKLNLEKMKFFFQVLHTTDDETALEKMMTNK